MRVLTLKSSGKLLQAQSRATEGTLLANAVREGYAENAVEERVVSDAQFAALLVASAPPPPPPVPDIRDVVEALKKKVGLTDKDISDEKGEREPSGVMI